MTKSSTSSCSALKVNQRTTKQTTTIKMGETKLSHPISSRLTNGNFGFGSGLMRFGATVPLQRPSATTMLVVGVTLITLAIGLAFLFFLFFFFFFCFHLFI